MADRIRPVGGQSPSRQVAKSPSGEDATSPSRQDAKTPRTNGGRFGWVRRLPWAVWLVIGVAVTLGTGYLVAALVFFPAPMLASERAVPGVIGASQRDAANTLHKDGLRDSVEARAPHPTASPGEVIWQDPPAGVAIPRGSYVSLVLSAGPPTVLVPDVRGYDGEVAQALLSAAGLRVDTTDAVDAKEVPAGAAEGTTPAAGERVEVGRAVTLHVAR